jgi:lipopolysaccharide assembly protein A
MLPESSGGTPLDRPIDPQAQPVLLPRTRTSAAFKGFAGGAVVLLLLLIFILENTERVKISYFGATGHIALGVALLLAAVGGALLIAIVGAARISQLRRQAKRRDSAP